MEGSGPSISVAGQDEEYFRSYFGLWLSGRYFSDIFCRPIMMYKVWRGL